MKFFFTMGEYHSVISVSVIVFDMEFLFNYMIQFRQIYVGEILTQIVTDWNSICAIYYLIKKL